MNILTIPFRNIRRKPAKTLMLLLVFTLGVVSIVSLVSFSRVVRHSLEQKLWAFGPNILVFPKTEQLRLSYGGMSAGNVTMDVRFLDEAAVLAGIDAIPNRANVRAVSPKLVSMAKIGLPGAPSGQETSVGVVGVRWDREKTLKTYWMLQGDYPGAADQLLAGHAIATRLGLKAGDRVSMFGRELVVSGVLDPTGSDDDAVFFGDLSFIQEQTGRPGKLNFLEVAAICAGCPIDDIVKQMRATIPDADITALMSVVEQRMYSLDFVSNLILAVSLIILFIACAMVGLSMMSSVNDRKREIGLLRSMGFSKGQIFQIVCFEAFLLGVTAGSVGYVIGFFASERILGALKMLEGTTLSFEPLHFAVACGVFGLVSMGSSLLPAWKASRIEPSEALVSI